MEDHQKSIKRCIVFYTQLKQQQWMCVTFSFELMFVNGTLTYINFAVYFGVSNVRTFQLMSTFKQKHILNLPLNFSNCILHIFFPFLKEELVKH